ncbi:blastula protease 10-like [Physella acuta]|uniref:blastula protease 10-like n=1 Tax=Physella acuta TaxID=109671 RepID=UPI0027DD815D|nr:blastula protease 10-like [Physella acuta]
MEDKFITTLFLTLFWSSLLIAGEDESAFCNTQPPGLTGYNQFCSISSQCVTGKCKDSKCVCDDGTTFSTCAVACVPDCNSTVTATTGTITSPSYPQSFAAYCTWTIQGPMETFIAFE